MREVQLINLLVIVPVYSVNFPDKARVACEGLNGTWERVLVETIESLTEFWPEDILGYP